MGFSTPYRDLVPPLSTDEREALKADIKSHGVMNPIHVDEDGCILDGHNRWDIACELDIEIDYHEIGGLTEREKVAYVYRQSNVRRNLSSEQRAALRRDMMEKAVEWNQDKSDKWTQAKIASEFGVGRETVRDWFANMRNGGSANTHILDKREKVSSDERQEMLDRLDSGETQAQVAADYKVDQSTVARIKQKEEKQVEAKAKVDAIAEQEAPEFGGLFDVIVVDPPWPIEKVERDVRPNQSKPLDYPTMSVEEIAGMSMPHKSDCHLWMWTTHRFLPDALWILEEWDYRYVCTFTWHKPGGFQPIGLPQYNSELALYARRGSPKFKTTKSFKVCFEAPRGKHSEKPSEFYDVVRRVTTGERIDIFNRRDIKGFKGWGNEC